MDNLHLTTCSPKVDPGVCHKMEASPLTVLLLVLLRVQEQVTDVLLGCSTYCSRISGPFTT